MISLDLIRRIRADAEALEQQILEASDASAISTADALARALVTASHGDTLLLNPALRYPGTLEITKGVTLQGPKGDKRVAAEMLPQLLGGLVVRSDVPVILSGVEIHHPDPAHEIVTLGGFRVTLDRCRVTGDGTNGAKRGVAANANGVVVSRSVIDQCFRRDQEAQGVCAWDMPGPLVLDDCWIAGSGQSILVGGADPSGSSRIPSDVLVINCTLTKRPEWRVSKIAVKTVFELKNARRVKMDNCTLSECWGGGQTGYLITLTPRNQNGTAPYSTIEDVVISHCYGTRAAGALNILGTDNEKPSQVLKRVAVEDCVFSGLDPVEFEGSNKLIQIGAGPQDVSIQRNVFGLCKNIGSTIYLYGTKSERLIVKDNVFPPSSYGIFGDNSSVGKAWDQYVTNGVLEGNTVK